MNIREMNAKLGVCPNHNLHDVQDWHSEDGYLHPEYATCSWCGKLIDFDEELIKEVEQGPDGEAVYTHVDCPSWCKHHPWQAACPCEDDGHYTPRIDIFEPGDELPY